MIDEEVVVVVVVVADSTGCNGSASRLTRRTRLDLSTYRKHRERGGQETPTILLILSCLSVFFLFLLLSVLVFSFLLQRLSLDRLGFLAGVLAVTVRENHLRVGDTKREK